MIEAVAGVAIRNQKVLLLHKRGYQDWFFPGGKFEDDEKSDLRCLTRELRQELGCGFCRGPKKIGVFTGNGLPKDGSVRLSCWLVKLNRSEIQLSLEHEGFAWVGKDEFVLYRIL